MLTWQNNPATLIQQNFDAGIDNSPPKQSKNFSALKKKSKKYNIHKRQDDALRPPYKQKLL